MDKNHQKCLIWSFTPKICPNKIIKNSSFTPICWDNYSARFARDFISETFLLIYKHSVMP